MAISRCAEEKRTSAEDKREKSRRCIMEASLELFYENGYQKTTIRDIIKRAGILNGSLYNRFKSKEEILLNIVTDMLNATLSECETLLKNERDMVVVTILPTALEVYISSRSPKAADLMYEVHRLWSTVNEYTKMNIDWIRRYFDKYGVTITDTLDAEISYLMLLGSVGNICGYYANGGDIDFRKILHHMASHVAMEFKLPMFDINSTIDKVMSIVEKCHIVLYEDGLDLIGVVENSDALVPIH